MQQSTFLNAAGSPFDFDTSSRTPLARFFTSPKRRPSKLNEMGLLPNARSGRSCFRCHSKMSLTQGSLTCCNRSCKFTIRVSSLAYTPLWQINKHGNLSYRPTSVPFTCYRARSPKTPQCTSSDGARTRLTHGMGTCATRSPSRSCMRAASSNSRSGSLKRTARICTSIAVRRRQTLTLVVFLVVYHNESKKYAFEPLPPKTVLKGDPPPPETYANVRPHWSGK